MRSFATPLATLAVLSVFSILGGVPTSFGRVDGMPPELIRTQARGLAVDGPCPADGLELRFGLDFNGNLVLDANEAVHPLTLCHPAFQPPLVQRPPLLVRVSSTPAGLNCPAGGARITAGTDLDGDERLSRAEENQISAICNAAFRSGATRPSLGMAVQADPAGHDRESGDEPQALLHIEADPGLSACPAGGSRVRAGLDSNRNGTLDSAEVDSTQQVCNPGGAAPTRQIESIASLPPAAQIGHTVQLSGAAGMPWRIRQETGERINTEALQGRDGGPWAATGPKAGWTAVAQSADGLRLLAAADGRLLQSTDGGVQWLPVGPTQNLRWGGVASSHDGTKLVATSLTDALYTSDDSGRSWVRRSIGLGWRLVASSADGQRLLATRHGWQLHVSDDAGQTWSRRAPVADWSGLAMSGDGKTLAAVGTGSRFYVSRDGGASWSAKGAPADHAGVAMTADGQRIVTASREAAPGLRWTDDSGDTWQEAGSADTPPGGFDAVAVSAKGHTLVAALRGGGFWTTSDGGQQWRREPGPSGVRSIAVSAEGLVRVAVAPGSEILRAAAATTPGQPGSLHLPADVSLHLRYQGSGIWAALPHRSAFYVQ